jgi:hypothetical protein
MYEPSVPGDFVRILVGVIVALMFTSVSSARGPGWSGGRRRVLGRDAHRDPSRFARRRPDLRRPQMSHHADRRLTTLRVIKEYRVSFAPQFENITTERYRQS